MLVLSEVTKTLASDRTTHATGVEDNTRASTFSLDLAQLLPSLRDSLFSGGINHMCKGPQASAALMDQMNRYSVGGLIATTSSIAENPYEDLDRIDAALRDPDSSRLELATTQPRGRGGVDHGGYAYNLPVTVDGLSWKLVDPEDNLISVSDLWSMIRVERTNLVEPTR